MPRCRSWKPGTCERHPSRKDPGQCRACWVPCHTRTPSPSVRCVACETAIAQLPANGGEVLDMIGEGRTRRSTLTYLARSPHPIVATAATEALERGEFINDPESA